MICGVQSAGESSHKNLMKCSKHFDDYKVPRWSEFWGETSIADWRQAQQDTYVPDEAWVIHARVTDLIDFHWSGGDPYKLAAWLDAHQFDCVYGQVHEHKVRQTRKLGMPWELYPECEATDECRVAMARGYWYVCDDGNLCPEFEQSAWDFLRPLQIHRYPPVGG